MQGASVDPLGRLRVVVGAPSSLATLNQGIAIEPDGRMCCTTNVPTSQFTPNGGMLVSSNKRLAITTFGDAPVNWCHGMPIDALGRVCGNLDTVVPPTATFNDGIAMGTNGVFMTSTPQPPQPTKKFDLKTFPLSEDILFTRASIGTYWDQNGILQTVTDNVPRPYCAPTGGEIKGLLVEESATNKVLYSEDFTNAIWSKITCSLRSPILAPDGKSLAYKLVTNAGSVGYITQSGVAYVAGQKEFYSVLARVDPVDGVNTFVLLAEAGLFTDAIARNARFNVSTGVVEQVSADAEAFITPASNGWAICTFGFTPSNSSSTASVQIRQPLTTGDGTKGIYVWGADSKTELIPTSHIPTTSAPVTRAADIAKVEGINFSSWWNPLEGTLLAKSMLPYVQTSAWKLRTAAIAARAVDSSNEVRCNSARTADGTAIVAVVTGSTQYQYNRATSNSAKLAVAYKESDMGGAIDGVAGAPQLSGTVVGQSLTTLYIGQSEAGTGILNGCVESISYWGVRLSTEQLKEITM